MNNKTILEQIQDLQKAEYSFNMLLLKVSDEIGEFIRDWDSNDPSALPTLRHNQINPVRRLYEFCSPAFPKDQSILYSQESLREIVSHHLGDNQLVALGLARATEEAAMVLFLDGAPESDDLLILRQAVKDLREKGSFQFTNN